MGILTSPLLLGLLSMKGASSIVNVRPTRKWNHSAVVHLRLAHESITNLANGMVFFYVFQLTPWVLRHLYFYMIMYSQRDLKGEVSEIKEKGVYP